MSISEGTPNTVPALPAVVELSGVIAPDLVEYVQHKIAVVLTHTGRAALHAHVRVVRHADPARERPVTARASLQFAGATVHAHADGSTAREAADRLLDRLDQRLNRISRTRRGDRSAPPLVTHPEAAAAVTADAPIPSATE